MRTDPGSPFTGNFVVMRHFPDRVESLVNRTRQHPDRGGQLTEREIADAADFEQELAAPSSSTCRIWPRSGRRPAR